MVSIITLPPHTIDRLQPLDVSHFKPFKTLLGLERLVVVLVLCSTSVWWKCDDRNHFPPC